MLLKLISDGLSLVLTRDVEYSGEYSDLGFGIRILPNIRIPDITEYYLPRDGVIPVD